ncbi:NUDIX domain-containing protein [Cryobacterium sp. Y11]|uniref:NUDIX domain-containing protein n=1 Tax=Cryobacterium sp. Y11 TaxID=2045016 RepID=UPI00130497BE|nr:NUDIX domain-containing protein [Cryobacterium sp. Y11]
MTRDVETGPVPSEDAASGAVQAGAVPLGVAATVVLLRDSAEGPEVLLLERPRHRGSFAGAWVFPGGGVDPDDRLPTDAAAPGGTGLVASATVVPIGSVPTGLTRCPLDAAAAAEAVEQRAARRAAVREVREETGLEVDPTALLATALWIPPASAPKRMRTWFYLAAAPTGPITLAEDEAIDYAWLRPEVALERHASAALTLVGPTWVTLHGLQGHGSVAEIVEHFTQRGLAHYATRLGVTGRGPVLFWAGDAAYDDHALVEQSGGRHRLEIGQLPWAYSLSD